MKFILKLLLAPLMLVLWIVEWALTLALKASAVVCVIREFPPPCRSTDTLWMPRNPE